jgi:hypothetical protein
MKLRARVLSGLALVGLGSPLGACGSSPEPAVSEQASAMLVCPEFGSCGVHPQCEDRDVCPPSAPKSGPGYDAPVYAHVEPKGWLACLPYPGFSDSLAAMDCTPEVIYQTGGARGPWATAFCRDKPNQYGTVIPCDTCTGTPPPGWVVFMWNINTFCDGFPTPTCNDYTCGELPI